MSRITISSDAIYTKLDEEIVILHQETGRYIGFDPVGSRMWELLVEHRDTTSVAAQIVEEYDIDEVVVNRDLEALVADMVTADLVVIER